MRMAIASPGNDFRLGACEAPPAIISMYLGNDLTEYLEEYVGEGNISYQSIRIILFHFYFLFLLRTKVIHYFNIIHTDHLSVTIHPILISSLLYFFCLQGAQPKPTHLHRRC